MTAQSRVIGIAGGSGVGKSTAAFYFQDLYPEQVVILHIDDYQKKSDKVPHLFGMTNWDDPNAIDFELLLQHLNLLLAGHPIEVWTKDDRDNPEYRTTGIRLKTVISPHPLIILEGYLALHHTDIRKLLSHAIFLDLPHAQRVKRRTKVIADGYTDKILVPMHQRYVEPTKAFANLVIEVDNLSTPQVAKLIEDRLVAEKLLKKAG